MRRLLALLVAAAAILTVGVVSTSASFTPVCITVQAGWGWNRVANEFVPGLTGAARDAFVWRIWAYEDNSANLTVGELVCIDPNDPALTTSTSSSSSSTTTATSVAPTTSTTSTSVAPTSTSTTAPTSTTTAPTTSTTTSSTTQPAATTTLPAPGPSTTLPPLPPPDQHPIANVPSNFTTSAFLASIAVPASTANEPTGNFRTICVPSHLAYDDPIVNPGAASAHLHLFFGNTLTNRNSTYNSLRTTGQSSCEGGPINRTGYWMPAVFDSQGRVVPPNLVVVYYKATASGGTVAQLQGDIATTQQLPNGLRMVAGAGAANSVGTWIWKCESGVNLGSTIPNSCPAGDDIYAQVQFPDCWDGVNLDSANHRSHLAYRSYNSSGRHVCPASHPVRIPSITETFVWMDNVSDVGGWSLSSDMGATDGSTLHADWFGAWDNPVQTRWHNSCLLGMRNSNNGNLCDGQTLTGWQWAGAIANASRLSGWTPMQP